MSENSWLEHSSVGRNVENVRGHTGGTLHCLGNTCCIRLLQVGFLRLYNCL